MTAENVLNEEIHVAVGRPLKVKAVKSAER